MKRRTFFATCLCVLTMACLAHAIRPIGATYVPFERFITNMEAFVKEDPNNGCMTVYALSPRRFRPTARPRGRWA